MRDLPALWASRSWRAGLEAWLLPALAQAGLTATGPMVQDRIRFWSTVLRVQTDGGRVWVKENAPSQAFEAALVVEVARLAPGRTAPVVAVEPGRGRLATLDLGTPLGSREAMPEDCWTELVGAWSRLQRDLVPAAGRLLDTGLTDLPATEAVRWALHLGERLAALPPGDPRRPDDRERRALEHGYDRLAAAAGELAASGLPASLDHNDLHLGNALRERSGQLRFIDLGDAVWANPLTTLRIPLWLLRGGGREGTLAARVLDEALEPWTDLLALTDLRALLPAAERISCLHRAVSWQRLLDDVPPGVPEPAEARMPLDWLLIAADPDPYARAARE